MSDRDEIARAANLNRWERRNTTPGSHVYVKGDRWVLVMYSGSGELIKARIEEKWIIHGAVKKVIAYLVR